ncbi:iron-containing alcohol dehydrogenase [candidate division KSB1 bacterium]|nr:iron-containing alcohol dehydrogenase [candidate division KSB1 bacterium]
MLRARVGLAAAHAIHNGLTALPETRAFYHGEKVAFDTLAGLQLTDALPDESETVFSFCKKVSLPTTLADIGLEDAKLEPLMLAAEKACNSESPLHHKADIITSEGVLHAIL